MLIALLMDGPQLSSRWPGQYTGILADDPGTSVLTITSIGMVNLSNATQKSPSACRVIGLWREPPQVTTEDLNIPLDTHTSVCDCTKPDRPQWQPPAAYPVEIPPDHHGVFLHLDGRWVRTYSMDGRDDEGGTVRFHLRNALPVALPNAPAWANESVPPTGS